MWHADKNGKESCQWLEMIVRFGAISVWPNGNCDCCVMAPLTTCAINCNQTSTVITLCVERYSVVKLHNVTVRTQDAECMHSEMSLWEWNRFWLVGLWRNKEKEVSLTNPHSITFDQKLWKWSRHSQGDSTTPVNPCHSLSQWRNIVLGKEKKKKSDSYFRHEQARKPSPMMPKSP